MKHLLRMISGFLPLGAGYALNAYMAAHLEMPLTIPLHLLGVGMLLLWGVISYCAGDECTMPVRQALELNIIGLLLLTLELVQCLVLHRHLLNLIGILSQVYFLPFTCILSLLAGILRIASQSIWAIDIAIFLVMLAISFAACGKKQKAMQANKEHP